MIKLLGALFMLIDHIGIIFYPDLTILRVIGRLAFPMFAYQITIGYKNTKDVKAYCIRLLILAIISQIPYYLIFGTQLNVIFTLLLGVMTLYLYNHFDKSVSKVLALISTLFLAQFLDTGYGAYGVFTIFIFYIIPIDLRMFFLFEITSLLYGLKYNFVIQAFSPLALLMLKFKMNYNLKLPKYFFYVFYPLHLFVLYIIRQLLVMRA